MYTPLKIYKPVANAVVSYKTETDSGVYDLSQVIDYALIPSAPKLTFPATTALAGFGTVVIDLLYESPATLSLVHLAGLSINAGLTISVFTADGSPSLVVDHTQDANSAIGRTANETLNFMPTTATAWQIVIAGVPVVDDVRLHFDIDSLFMGVVGFELLGDNYSWGFTERDAQNYEFDYSSTQAHPRATQSLASYQLALNGINDGVSREFGRFQKSLNKGFCFVDTNPADLSPETKVLGTITSSVRTAQQLEFNTRTLIITEKRNGISY